MRRDGGRSWGRSEVKLTCRHDTAAMGAAVVEAASVTNTPLQVLSSYTFTPSLMNTLFPIPLPHGPLRTRPKKVPSPLLLLLLSVDAFDGGGSTDLIGVEVVVTGT